MPMMELIPNQTSTFTDWIASLAPGFSAVCTRIGPTRSTVRVTVPDGTVYEVHQLQTFDAEQQPDLSWIITITG